MAQPKANLNDDEYLLCCPSCGVDLLNYDNVEVSTRRHLGPTSRALVTVKEDGTVKQAQQEEPFTFVGVRISMWCEQCGAAPVFSLLNSGGRVAVTLSKPSRASTVAKIKTQLAEY